MQNQNLNPQEQPAGQVRVKKEEFARAIAALEARRQAQAQELEGTVVIGDVLQQLQINMPADEVLQEIEAIHAGQPREKAIRRPFWNAEKTATSRLVVGIALVPIAAVAITVFILKFPNAPNPASLPAQSGVMGSKRDLPLSLPPPPSNPAGAADEIMDEGGFNASSVLKPLSEVPDNQPVHCNTTSLMQLCESYSRSVPPHHYTYERPYGTLDPVVLAQSSQLFDVRPNLHKPWIIVKHNGELYFRAWVAAKFTAAQAQGRLVTFHNSPASFDPGIQPVQITVPLSFNPAFGGHQISPVSRFADSLLADEVQIDSHAYEKW